MKNFLRRTVQQPATQMLLAAAATITLSGCLAAETSPSNLQLSGSATVVDGDGLRLAGQTIRIHGIDAPEASQYCVAADGGRWPCGAAATRRLSSLVAGAEVRCRETDRDRYGRVVASCEAGGVDVGGVLVTEGLAWAYRRYSSDYISAEIRARQSRVGVWSAANQPPWEFRTTGSSQQPAVPEVARSTSSSCQIKGNISRNGNRIYHVPGSRDYNATRIDTRQGERWFCSEAEARAAGWRAPRSR